MPPIPIKNIFLEKEKVLVEQNDFKSAENLIKKGYQIIFLKNLNNRKTHIVLTGRGASDSIINYADLVTEMKLIRHPFKEQGIKAQKCVEF